MESEVLLKESQIKEWLKMLTEMHEGMNIRMGSNHVNNLERAYEKSQLYAKHIREEMEKVING